MLFSILKGKFLSTNRWLGVSISLNPVCLDSLLLSVWNGYHWCIPVFFCKLRTFALKIFPHGFLLFVFLSWISSRCLPNSKSQCTYSLLSTLSNITSLCSCWLWQKSHTRYKMGISLPRNALDAFLHAFLFVGLPPYSTPQQTFWAHA